MSLQSFWQEDLASLSRVLHSSREVLDVPFEKALEGLFRAVKAGGKAIVFGNGGSAADADHMVGEFIGKFGYDRPPLPAVTLTGTLAGFTAIANDYSYETAFERQLRGLARKEDAAIGITTSGNSKNVVLALKAAKELGLFTIALTGAADSEASKVADVTLRSPSRETPRIQEIHAILIHSLCRGVESKMFPKPMTVLPAKKILEEKDIESFAQSIRPYRSVFTNGCFDILHPGHVALLAQARRCGDFLILGLNSDESVKKLKGSGRPFHAFADRANILAALSMVDYVVGFSEETPLDLIKRLTPKVLVKGGDYSRETIVGAGWVEEHGGEVRVIPLVSGHSTTRILANGT